LQSSGLSDTPMVAEEVPLVACGQRVGVKGSREQANRSVAATVQVRPALDADPAKPVASPTMELEGRGATSKPHTKHASRTLPLRPPSLLIAALPLATTTPSDVTDITRTGAGFTHGMFGGSLGGARHGATRSSRWLTSGGVVVVNWRVRTVR
jgi:hypothetical protein